MDNTAFENLSDLRNEFDKAEKHQKRKTMFFEALTLIGIFAMAYAAFIMFV